MYRRFNEQYALLGAQHADSFAAAEYNLAAFVNGEEFAEYIVLLDVGDMAAGATVNMDFEVATNAAGAGVQTVKSITQLTQAGGDGDDNICMVVSAEECEAALAGGGFVNVEITVGTDAVELSMVLLGGKSRYEPVSEAAWTECLDPVDS